VCNCCGSDGVEQKEERKKTSFEVSAPGRWAQMEDGKDKIIIIIIIIHCRREVGAKGATKIS
jgi:hypothetical protein